MLIVKAEGPFGQEQDVDIVTYSILVSKLNKIIYDCGEIKLDGVIHEIGRMSDEGMYISELRAPVFRKVVQPDGADSWTEVFETYLFDVDMHEVFGA